MPCLHRSGYIKSEGTSTCLVVFKYIEIKLYYVQRRSILLWYRKVMLYVIRYSCSITNHGEKKSSMNWARTFLNFCLSSLPRLLGWAIRAWTFLNPSFAGKSLRSFTFPTLAQLWRATHVSMIAPARRGMWARYPPLLSKHLQFENISLFLRLICNIYLKAV